MASAAETIRYLAACYDADQRDSGVVDLFHKDVRHRHFATGKEVLLTRLQDGLALPADVGEQGRKAAATYRRERALLYGVFCVLGQYRSPDGRSRQLAGPLFFYPASIREETLSGNRVYYLQVHANERVVNVSVLAALRADAEESEFAEIESSLGALSEESLDDKVLSELIYLLQEMVPELDVSALYSFPALAAESLVRSELREVRNGARPRCIPAAAMALVPKPRGSRGILFELSEIAEESHDSTSLSAPMQALLLGGKRKPKSPTSSREERDSESDFLHVPATLSRSQTKVLRSARNHPLTLVVGPPGTGKSYTVSALAVDYLMQGRSVLVACRTDQALDVIADKMRTLLGDTTSLIRGGTRDYRRELKHYLEGLLSGRFEDEAATRDSERERARRLRRAARTIRKLEDGLLDHARLECAWGELEKPIASGTASILERLRYRWLDWRLSRNGTFQDRLSELRRQNELRIENASTLLVERRRSRLGRLLAKKREHLRAFLSALRARTSARQDRFFSEIDLDTLLEAFPLWLTTFRDLHRLAPLEKELFDLVVVDEATQCDMASALTALHRARRAVVTGDPHQLRHVSFLSRARQGSLAAQNGLDDGARDAFDYRDKSLLDLVDVRLGSQDQVGFLNEHYRSLPSIIGFSNREFYDSRLHVMTEKPGHRDSPAIEIHRVDGERSASGVNEVEADALVGKLLRFIESERYLPSGVAHSVGILSPFRDQVDHLSERILAELSTELIEKHDVRIATPYGFQGDEKDAMFLSLALDDESHPASFRYINRPDVFNVSITRARDRQLVFTSLARSFGSESLLARYLREVEERSAKERKETTFDPAAISVDAFAAAVAESLGRESFRVFSGYPVAGIEVDLVVERDDRAFGIDLIGHPGRWSDAIALERYRMLRRAGLPLFALSYREWRDDGQNALRRILHFASQTHDPRFRGRL